MSDDEATEEASEKESLGGGQHEQDIDPDLWGVAMDGRSVLWLSELETFLSSVHGM